MKKATKAATKCELEENQGNMKERQSILVGGWRGRAHTPMKTSHTVQSRRLNALFLSSETVPKRESESKRYIAKMREKEKENNERGMMKRERKANDEWRKLRAKETY